MNDSHDLMVDGRVQLDELRGRVAEGEPLNGVIRDLGLPMTQDPGGKTFSREDVLSGLEPALADLLMDGDPEAEKPLDPGPLLHEWVFFDASGKEVGRIEGDEFESVDWPEGFEQILIRGRRQRDVPGADVILEPEPSAPRRLIRCARCSGMFSELGLRLHRCPGENHPDEKLTSPAVQERLLKQHAAPGGGESP